MQCPHLEALKEHANASKSSASAPQYPAINVGPSLRDYDTPSLSGSFDQEHVNNAVARDQDEEPRVSQEKWDGANKLLQWRKDQGFALLDVVVDQVLHFLSFTPLSLLHQIIEGSNSDLLDTHESFSKSFIFLRKNYKLSDPDWWPFISAKDRPNHSDHRVFVRRHNLVVSILMLLRPSIKLRELHGNFFSVMLDEDEPLSTELAELFYAMKLDLVIASWPMSPVLFSFAFPQDSKEVLKIEGTGSSLDEVSEGAKLLVSRCAYVREQYDEGHLTSKHTLELIRGGQAFIATVKRALPYLIQVIERVRLEQAQSQTRSSRPTRIASPPDNAAAARFIIAPENLASTAAYLAKALSTVDLRPKGKITPPLVVSQSSRTAVSTSTNNTTDTVHTVLPSTESTISTPAYSRRVWSSAEESALLNGLASVGGPHWTKILALHGANGSESDVLKDRNQVQLKDKARNLKMACLKAGEDVPEALKGVTGDLEKRRVKRKRAVDDVGDVEVEGEDAPEREPDERSNAVPVVSMEGRTHAERGENDTQALVE